MVFILSILSDVPWIYCHNLYPGWEPPIVTRYKPFGSPNMGEFFFPVVKQFPGKGNEWVEKDLPLYHKDKDLLIYKAWCQNTQKYSYYVHWNYREFFPFFSRSFTEGAFLFFSV